LEMKLYVIVEEGLKQEAYLECGGFCASTPLLVIADVTTESGVNAQKRPQST